jgi:ABC-2 type transport system permease protein
MSALVLWELCVRATYEIGVSMIREIYSRTLLDLFSTPLTISEWLVGLMITGLIRMFVSLIFCTGVVWLLYALNIFSLGCSMVLLIIPLIIFGWTTGFLCAGFIIYFGQKVESLPWMALFLFAPFSAVYYPITVLPYWMQVVAYCLPSSYVFETLRLLISTHQFSYSNYLISLVLGSIYLTLSIIFFYYMFCKSKKLGLARL